MQMQLLTRGITLLGDGIVVSIMFLAIQFGLLDHNTAIAIVGYALRAVIQPSLTTNGQPIIPVNVNLPGGNSGGNVSSTS